MVARALVIMILIAGPAKSDSLAYQEVAAYVGVPPDILYAIALAESADTVDGEMLPWPWTLNIAGDSRRFADRSAMFAALMSALGEGTQSIDVGPMQINWFWQYEHIHSPWRLTDPGENLKLAAQLLKVQYALCGDWWEAVGRYHRPSQTASNRAIAHSYRESVRSLHRRMIAEADSHER